MTELRRGAVALVRPEPADSRRAVRLARLLQLNTDTPPFTPLAVIGIGCLFPKSAGTGFYWANVKQGVDCIGDVPPTHWLTGCTCAGWNQEHCSRRYAKVTT